MSALKRASKAKSKTAIGSTPRAQLDAFIDKYSVDVARQARAAFSKMRRRLPAATILVYDNYNALAIGFGPGEQSSKIVFSIALDRAGTSLDDGGTGPIIIRLVSARQRPRRPALPRAASSRAGAK